MSDKGRSILATTPDKRVVNAKATIRKLKRLDGIDRARWPCKRGKEKLVILSAAQYHQLVGQPHSVAYTLEEAPDEVHDELMTGLDAIISGDTPHA